MMSPTHDASKSSRVDGLGRRSGPRAGLVRAVLLVAMLACSLLVVPPGAGASEPTNSGDNLRDGWYPEQAALTPQLVSGGTFGQLWSASVEGSVYAQPLLANGDGAGRDREQQGLRPGPGDRRARNGRAPLDLGTAWKAADIGCGDLTPNIGVTATPVDRPARRTPPT